MTLLDQLGRLHGTDKASDGHDYLRFYERFLSPFPERPITLLEMGVGSGASLFMWRDYFPLAQIVGLDIDESRRQYAGPRITIEIGDQADAAVLHKLAVDYGPFDVVVDDAGHHGPSQIFSYTWFLPDLRDGGVYILEDIGDPAVSDHLVGRAKAIIHGQGDSRLESIAFYRETSVTRLK